MGMDSMNMGGRKWVTNAKAPLSGMDGGDAEQMALFITYFAESQK
jgi:hypothetical protein